MEIAPSYVTGALLRGDQRRNLSLQLLARNEPLEGPLSEAQRFTTQHLSEKRALTSILFVWKPPNSNPWSRGIFTLETKK